MNKSFDTMIISKTNPADRFWQEVLKRKNEFMKIKLPKYLLNLYENLESNKDKDSLLMYSVILQNYATREI